MRIVSWNVNGYRAVLRKGFLDWLGSCKADVVLLQETKVEPDQLDPVEREPDGWSTIWNWSKKRRGYSGTACFLRHKPISYSFGLPKEEFRGEGRSIILEYPEFWLLNIYFPNGQMSEERLSFKLRLYEHFLEYVQDLRKAKPVVVGGDFNTAHNEMDVTNFKANEKKSGFLPIERSWLDRFIAHGYLDTFRIFKSGPGHYSWWSYRYNSRKNNVGWRIDYFFVSEEMRGRIKMAWIESLTEGSDHCPVWLELTE